MQWTGLNELREKYLHYFEGKGHLRLGSFPTALPSHRKNNGRGQPMCFVAHRRYTSMARQV